LWALAWLRRDARPSRVGSRWLSAPAGPAPDHIRALFDPSRIEDVVLVRECAFDAVKLRERLSLDLDREGVGIQVRATVTRVSREKGHLRVEWTHGGTVAGATAARVYNCTYAGLNGILAASGAAIIPLKRELS
jgi:hypothetical protein